MEIKEYLPKNKLVAKYVSKYQLIEVDSPLFVKTIPTGTLECCIMLDGYFETFNPEQGKFMYSEESGFFPIGNTINSYFIRDYVKCFVIKMKPITLGLRNFNGFIENWKNFPIESLLGSNGQEKIMSLDFTKTAEVSDQIDLILTNSNDFSSLDSKIETLITSIFSENGINLKISQLADKNNLTMKSLERLTKEYFAMSPKKLMNIIRFGISAVKLRESEGFKFIDTLEFGYYDQSHFIRECKRITGLNPKKFLSKLNLGAHDVLSEDL